MEVADFNLELIVFRQRSHGVSVFVQSLIGVLLAGHFYRDGVLEF